MNPIILAIFLGLAPADTVDAGLVRYVEAFKQEASARGIQLPARSPLRIKFVRSSISGGYYKATRTIEISAAFKGQPKTLELIIFHELGHAWLGLDHDEERTCLMNAKPSPELYRKLRTEYLDQLFLGTPVFR